MGQAGASGDERKYAQDKPASDHRDTPPEDVVDCRGRSPGSRVTALVRPSRDLTISVTRIGRALAAHSCGGSAGITSVRGSPASLLAQGTTRLENHDIYI